VFELKEFHPLLNLIPIEPLSLICGKLLGDGNLSIEKKRKPRFRFQHRLEDKGWCNHCYDHLKKYIPLAEPKYKYTKDSRLIKGYSESFFVQSRTSEVFSLLKKFWYIDHRKVIPFNLLDCVLSVEGIAWWYQDDGCLITDNGTPRKIILSTDNFTNEENKELIKLIAKKFLITFSIDGQNRLCLYDQKQIYFFLNYINPFIHESMNRKRLKKQENRLLDLPLPCKKRTTIYLPQSIQITHPTKEIQNIIDQLNPNEITTYQGIFEFNNNLPNKGYQIILLNDHLSKLISIKTQTGLSYSNIVFLAFSLIIK
jgi:hypothetical protein